MIKIACLEEQYPFTLAEVGLDLYSQFILLRLRVVEENLIGLLEVLDAGHQFGDSALVEVLLLHSSAPLHYPKTQKLESTCILRIMLKGFLTVFHGLFIYIILKDYVLHLANCLVGYRPIGVVAALISIDFLAIIK